MAKARYLEGGKFRPKKGVAPPLNCSLCPHGCVVPDGMTGLCKVRVNRGGTPYLPFYGRLSALAVDPIEKKPLFHFRPGTHILSAGFWGCNLRCPFCQNWSISQGTKPGGRVVDAADLIQEVHQAGLDSIAYTYSEPLVHLEFLLETMTAAHGAGIANVLVTNGCINDDPSREILALTDAMNVDLKAFSQETYRTILGGDLDRVLNFICRAVDLGVHLEVTTLVVPNLNDGEEELDRCAVFLSDLSPSIPWHLSAYHPAYKWTAPPTDREYLKRLARRASERLKYVYLGNLGLEESNTLCIFCGAVLVRRLGYGVEFSALRITQRGDGGRSFACASCGEMAPFRA